MVSLLNENEQSEKENPHFLNLMFTLINQKEQEFVLLFSLKPNLNITRMITS